MAKYKAYPEYKDSGVEFLSRVPNEWSVKSLKNIVMIVNGSTPKSGVEEYWDGDINWITPTDLSQKPGIYLNDSQRKITNKGLDSCGTSLVPEDTVILSTRAPIGSLAITGTQSCTNQGCKSLVVKNKENILFLYYYLSISTSPLNNLGRGSTFLELSTEDLATFKVPMPNEGIGKIVSFLEHETAKIDNLIEKQQQLIELLKEKRQAVISHAVTKGLNPDVPMKDSGVEWLGEVPEHWVSIRVKQISSFITSGPRGWSDFITDDGNEVFLQSGDLNNELGLQLDKAKRVSPPKNAEGVRTKLIAGDVVVCITGANTGRVAIVPELSQSTYINQHLSLIRPNISIINSAFLGYSLASSVGRSFFDVAQYGLKEGLSLGNVSEVPLALPPKHEQDAIIKYLESIRNNYDNLSRLSTIQIELLKERRTALISAAVTGKIDVRDWVAPNACEAEVSQEITA